MLGRLYQLLRAGTKTSSCEKTAEEAAALRSAAKRQIVDNHRTEARRGHNSFPRFDMSRVADGVPARYLRFLLPSVKRHDSRGVRVIRRPKTDFGAGKPHTSTSCAAGLEAHTQAVFDARASSMIRIGAPAVLVDFGNSRGVCDAGSSCQVLIGCYDRHLGVHDL